MQELNKKNMQKIEIKLPQIEGAELKNVTTNIENGYVVAEYGEKEKKCEFRRGDIVIVNECDMGECIANIKDVHPDTITVNYLYAKDSGYFGSEIERMTVLNEMAQKAEFKDIRRYVLALQDNGKYKDGVEIKDLIKVPDSIGIYRSKEDFGIDGDGLYIAFNNNKQLLYYNSKYNVWSVCPLHNGYKKVQCYLQPCKREDLKSGDTSYFSASLKEKFDSLYFYCKVLSEYKFAQVTDEVIQLGDRIDFEWYKLIPING